MASLADLASRSPTPRARARANEPTVFTVTWETCRRKCRTCVALPKVQRGVQTWRPLPTWRQGLPTWHQGARWRGRTWRQNVASRGHVRRRQASKRGVTDPRGVREPGGVAGRGVKTWRHWPTWRQKPGGVAGRGVKMWRHLPTWRQKPGGVAGRGVKMWRHLPTWRQGATCGRRSSASAHASGLTWRRRTWRQNVASLAHVASGSHVASPGTWRQNVASGAIDLRGVTGRGVKKWRHEARPPGTCLQNVSSVVGRYVHPHRRPPCEKEIVYCFVLRWARQKDNTFNPYPVKALNSYVA